MFLNTSLDILYITLSVCIVAFTIFLCWGMYYLVRLLRNGVYMVEKITIVMKKADEVLDLIQEKLGSTGTYLSLAASTVQSAMEYFAEKKEKKATKKRRTTKK